METTNEQATRLTDIVHALAKEKINQGNVFPYWKLIDSLFESCEKKVLAGDYLQRDMFANNYQIANTEAIIALITHSKDLSDEDFVDYSEKIIHMCKQSYRLREAFIDFIKKNSNNQIESEFGSWQRRGIDGH